MHILRVPSFFLAKKWGPIRRGAGPDPALVEVLIQLFSMTSASSTGDILYYLLAGGTESGSKSISCFMALSGGVPGFSKTSLNSL